jgi:16S rRNA (cytidine1402-2'-O)-methyltransferase
MSFLLKTYTKAISSLQKPSSTPSRGVLYSCATPIGNLQDCSERLLETLRSVDLIAAEDTRVTQKLLTAFGIKKRMISHQKFNERKTIPALIQRLEEGQSIALVSDAGTPAISDPGHRLLEAVAEAGLQASPIPGPSSLTAFLSVSGLPSDFFTFGGFFPRQKGPAQAILDKTLGSAMVFFESGNRLIDTLFWIQKTYTIDRLVVGKELTKQYEYVAETSVMDLSEMVKADPSRLKGEWIFGVILSEKEGTQPQNEKAIEYLRAKGLTTKDLIEVGKMTDLWNRKEVYEGLKND